MDATTAKVLHDAMKLSPEGRAELAGSLLQSLDMKFDADAEQRWAEEVRRRVEAIDAGRVELVPWAEARKQILES